MFSSMYEMLFQDELKNSISFMFKIINKFINLHKGKFCFIYWKYAYVLYTENMHTFYRTYIIWTIMIEIIVKKQLNVLIKKLL